MGCLKLELLDEIYGMNFTDKIARLVYRNLRGYNIKAISVSRNTEKILFIMENDNTNFYSINFDGTGLQQISFVIP